MAKKGLNKFHAGVEKNVESNYIILLYLSQFLTPKKIAELEKISFQAVYRRINNLIKKGYVRKVSGSYELTEGGLNLLAGLHKSLLRLHNLKFKIKIIYAPKNWELKRKRILILRNNFAKEISLKNHSYQVHTFGNIKVETTTKSIIVDMPNFFGRTTEECFSQAMNTLFTKLPLIESTFDIVLVKNRKVNIEIISQHYAKIQDSLAKLYRIEGNKLYVTDDKGKVWLIADYSFRQDELETISTESADEDMNTVKSFFDDLRKNPCTMTEALGLIRDVTANQIVFDKNMASHIEAVRLLGANVKRLVKVIGGLKLENIKLKEKEQTTLGDYYEGS